VGDVAADAHAATALAIRKSGSGKSPGSAGRSARSPLLQLAAGTRLVLIGTSAMMLTASPALAAAPTTAAYARVDIVPDDQGMLRIMELELIEPSLFLDHAPDAGAFFSRSILSRARTATA